MKKSVLTVMAFAIIALLGLGTVSAFGMGGALSDEDKEFAKANREAIREAIEAGDYASWEGLMQERLAMLEDNINEETFNKMTAHHANMQEFKAAVEELRGSGDFSREAMEGLRTEYGIEGKGPKERGFEKGFRMGKRSSQKHEDFPLAE
jgi:hypothetical protein